MKKTVTKPKVKTEVYKASIKVFGRTYEATGASVKEAIANLKAPNVRGKGILILEHGDKKKERILMPGILFRLFNTAGLSKEISVNMVSRLFDL